MSLRGKDRQIGAVALAFMLFAVSPAPAAPASSDTDAQGEALNPADGTVEGFLLPDHKPNGDDPCRSSGPGLRLLFGTNAVIATTFPHAVIASPERVYLQIDRDKAGDIGVTGAFRSEPGFAEAIIVGNKFDVDADRVDHFTETRHRLTILGAHGQTVLDVWFLNPSTVRLSGILFVHGRRVDLSEGGQVAGSRMSGDCLGLSPHDIFFE